jgi:hypothetical protein
MITAQDCILNIKFVAGQIEQLVRKAAGDDRALHEVEEEVAGRVRELGRLAVQGFVSNKAPCDKGEAVRTAEGGFVPRKGIHTRPYVSPFGEIEVERTCYGRRRIEVAPLDAELGLAGRKHSYLLEKWSQMLTVSMPFASAGSVLEELVGVRIPVRTLENLNREVARDVEGFFRAQPSPAPGGEDRLTVACADGISLPVCRDTEAGERPTRRRGERRAAGHNASKRRQATCTALYSIRPFIRGPDDVLREMGEGPAGGSRPRPEDKWVRGYLVGGKEAAFEWLATHSARRRRTGQEDCPGVLLVIMDGDPALWDRAQRRLGRQGGAVVGILDIYHVLERLWDVAYLFHPKQSPEAQEFVRERLRKLLNGRVGRMIGGLKQMANKRGWSLAARRPGRPRADDPAPPRESRAAKTLRLAVEYFESNRDHMRYNEYLRAGYPIGSGVVEGTCRNLVKDRMDRTGMRWQPEGAQAMLDTRSVLLSGLWDEFWHYRIQADQQRLYGSLQPLATVERRAAA